MQGDKPNYWQPDPNDHGSADGAKITEMYQPVGDTVREAHQPHVGLRRADVGEEPVRWSANEYITEEKGGLWFILFVIVVLSLIAISILLFQSYTFAVLVVVMAVALMVYSRRMPRTIDYTLSGGQGLYIDEALHHFSEFKAFGLIHDNGRYFIMLIPTKRFAPAISVYLPEEVGEKVVDIFGARLPMRQMKLDAIDVLIRKLHL